MYHMIGSQGSPPPAGDGEFPESAVVAAGLPDTGRFGLDGRTKAELSELGRKLAEAKETLHRPDFRRAVVAGTVAVAAPAVDYWLGGIHAHRLGYRIGSLGAVLACLLFGVMAVRSAADETARITRRRGGPAVAGTLRLSIIVVGYGLVAVTVLGLLYVPLDRLLLSGAITGVVVGIAAQQSLGNAFAGLVLLFSRPFAVGDYIVLRSGALGGQYDGEVTAITLMYTILQTPEGPMTFPNSGVLAAATGLRNHPGPSSSEADRSAGNEPAETPV